jgi:hypothetical protein
MKHLMLVLVTLAVVMTTVLTGGAWAMSDSANCVGQFSAFFAQNDEVHRSDIALDFAKNAQPAGQNVYRHVAQTHGTLEDCFAQN